MAAREIPRKRRAGRTPPPERRAPAPGEKARASVAAAGADAPDGPDPGAGGTASFPPGLYIVPTPLGNMGDMSPRAVTALRKSALAASEDTRRTAKLLNFLGISLPQVSYREQSHAAAWPRVRDALARGLSVALMTDAGSPGVSDPGAALAAAARAGGFAVYPLPGPSAVTTALSASGFPAASFTFCGFAPARSAARKAWIAGFRRLAHPLVFFEAPHRLAESLADFLEVLGPRRALAAREMTKLHEEYVFGDLAALAADVSANPRKGEVTLVVEGAPRGQGAAARTEGFFVELGGLEEEGCPGLAADAAPGGDPGAAPGRCPEGQPDGDPGAAPGSGLESQPWGPEGLIEAEPCSVDGGESSGAEGGGRGSPPDAEPPEEGGDRGPLCSPRSVAALKTLFEAARADDRRLSESARELAGLTGIPKKALYALLSHFRSPEG